MITSVFMDDIELALNTDYNIDLKLDTKKELSNNDEYFAKYLEDKLVFKINNKTLKFNYLGKEYDGDLVFFYVEVPDVTDPQPLEITNKILMAYFEDQRNIVKYKIGNKKTSEILTKGNDKALLKF